MASWKGYHDDIHEGVWLWLAQVCRSSRNTDHFSSKNPQRGIEIRVQIYKPRIDYAPHSFRDPMHNRGPARAHNDSRTVPADRIPYLNGCTTVLMWTTPLQPLTAAAGVHDLHTVPAPCKEQPEAAPNQGGSVKVCVSDGDPRPQEPPILPRSVGTRTVTLRRLQRMCGSNDSLKLCRLSHRSCTNVLQTG